MQNQGQAQPEGPFNTESTASAPPTFDSTVAREGSTFPGKKGRPRDQVAHQAILEYTRKLAIEKTRYKDITVESIALGAKVSKSTIYRWWKTKAELIREACLMHNFKVPNKGSLIEDLEGLVRQEVDIQTKTASRPIFAGAWAELVELHNASGTPPGLVTCFFELENREMLSIIFAQATARGEWSGSVDLESAYEALFSAVFYRCIGRCAIFDEKRVKRLARHIKELARIDKE